MNTFGSLSRRFIVVALCVLIIFPEPIHARVLARPIFRLIYGSRPSLLPLPEALPNGQWNDLLGTRISSILKVKAELAVDQILENRLPYYLDLSGSEIPTLNPAYLQLESKENLELRYTAEINAAKSRLRPFMRLFREHPPRLAVGNVHPEIAQMLWEEGVYFLKIPSRGQENPRNAIRVGFVTAYDKQALATLFPGQDPKALRKIGLQIEKDLASFREWIDVLGDKSEVLQALEAAERSGYEYFLILNNHPKADVNPEVVLTAYDSEDGLLGDHRVLEAHRDRLHIISCNSYAFEKQVYVSTGQLDYGAVVRAFREAFENVKKNQSFFEDRLNSSHRQSLQAPLIETFGSAFIDAYCVEMSKANVSGNLTKVILIIGFISTVGLVAYLIFAGDDESGYEEIKIDPTEHEF